MDTDLSNTTLVEKLEEKLNKAQQKIKILEKMIEQHTKELYLKNIALEQQNKELDQFSYIISHDLKAPLRAIGSLSNFLLTDYEDKLDESGKEQLHLLVNRAQRMNSLIEGVLRYSKVGRIKNEVKQVNLNNLINDIIDAISPPGNIELYVENDLPILFFEISQMEQIFQNLIGNAIKYTDKPKGVIKIGCEDKGECWQFYVADNGPGIDSKYFEKIFQIFQTLSSRDEKESTGIGLTIVKKIIETNGGHIWVESKMGEGCTFFFTIPK